MKRFWELKQSSNPDTLELYIYGDVESGYYDWWSEKKVDNERSSDFFREKLSEHQNVSNINLYINSWGGSVYEAYGMCSQLLRHPATKTCYIDGFAVSAASLFPMVCDKVIMPSNTVMLVHNMLSYVFGNSKELRKEADNLDKLMEGNRTLYMRRAKNMTEEQLVELLAEEKYLTAKECLELGFCDEVVEPVDMSKANELLESMNKSFEQRLFRQKAITEQLKQMLVPDEPIIPIKDEPKATPLSELFLSALR